MRLAAGRPLLAYVLDALDFISPCDCVIVVGYEKEKVIRAFPNYCFAEQSEQLGTGHAALCAFSALGDFSGELIICCGDMPLLRRETYLALVEAHEDSGNACTILTGTSDLPLPYGRILRDESGAFLGVVEEKDATASQREITELNSGVYVFSAPALKQVLSELSADNAQGEYYLTDAPLLIMQRGHKVGVCERELGSEILGVNTPEQLSLVERLIGERK
jgi:bifunctional N-acetylglucosamine-1-phosphate-uridyltransferase/glucosamine-1-phosphate-acetyltransferase GlmU-like protein